MTEPAPAHAAVPPTPVAPDRRLPPTWRELHPGEDPWGEAMQIELWRAAGPAALERPVADLLLGAELARVVYGPLPTDVPKP
jgi:hypothetical protein